ncbi:MAG: hypothetical protein AB1453_02440 [Chloroflexota bacterium]
MRFFKTVFTVGIAALVIILLVNTVPYLAQQQIPRIQPTPAATESNLPAPFHHITAQPPIADGHISANFSAGAAAGKALEQTNATPTPLPTLVAYTPTPATTEDEFEPKPDPQIVTCAEIWQIPEIPLNLPLVLEFPRSIEELYTEYNYYYLAAMLIQNKVVNASQCPYNGLQSITTANQCGVEVARPVVIEWQNQYDSKIFETGVNFGIPSRILKKVFAIESQFWPAIYIDILESGFGQLNDTGADALLMFNPHFFSQFCPLILHPNSCSQGYLAIPDSARAMLRGALVRQVNATCPECPQGVNRSRAMSSIPVFAEVLKANCRQMDFIVRNVTSRKPGEVADYADLWKLTVANYNAGPGCTSRAIEAAWKEHGDLDWSKVVNYFKAEECQSAPFYINDIFED